MLGYWNTRTLVRLLTTLAALALAIPCWVDSQTKPASPTGENSIAKAVGTIKTVQSNSITIAAESGGDVTANLASTTKILRVPPGEKDLKNAVALQPQDLQPGDRVLVRGQASADPHTIAALSVIVMKQADVSAKQQRERDDWQKRGIGGLVSQVDAAAQTITVSTAGLGASHNIIVHIGKDTILRRYSPASVKFDDAKPAPLDQIKAGDQLRARGARSPDGNDLTAEEVVSGTFRNIAGTITAVDTANNTMTVQDLIAKGPVVVKVSSDSQMKKLPADMAQRMAARLKGSAASNGDQSGENASTPASSSSAADRRSPESSSGRGQSGTSGASGSPDLQRLLARLPSSTLADLQKGDAVMIVSSQGGDSGAVTAITLLAGVDPILTAAPSRAASSLLSPWSLNTSAGEGESAP